MSRAVPIRWSLTRDVVFGIVLFSSLILVVLLLANRDTVRRLSGALTATTISQAEERLKRFFEPIEQQLHVLSSVGRDGRLRLDETDALESLFTPIMIEHPHISSMVIGDGRGGEFRLIRHANGSWSSREVRPDDWGPRVRWRRWVPGQDGARAEDWQDGPNSNDTERPWFAGAIESAGTERVHWTEPYVTAANRVLGVTASAPFDAGDGVQRVIGIDVLLDDISKFTTSVRIGTRGTAAIVDRYWRLVGLPRDPRYLDVDERREYILKEPQELGWQVATDARAEYERFFRENPDPAALPEAMRFGSDGEAWWVDARQYFLGGDQLLWIAVLIPETDLLGDLRRSRYWVTGLALGILVLAVFRVVKIAYRFSQPIEKLVEQSDRFGRGELDEPTTIDSRVDEIRRLARAQEQMRLALRSVLKLEGDLRIARHIQQAAIPKTLPEVPGWDIGAWNEPADETGGDIYDVFGFRVSNWRSNGVTDIKADEQAEMAVLLLADATGHGIGSALSAMQIRAMLRMAVRLQLDAPLIIRHMNEQLHNDLPAGRFITAWTCVLRANQGRVDTFSAGQGPILLYRRGDDRFEHFDADVPPLGVFDEIESGVMRQLELDKDDIIVVTSDGITEAESDEGDEFGVERLERVIRAGASGSASALIEQIKRELDHFVGSAVRVDDRTVLAVKRE